jgi:hypothetical protein
MKKLLILATPRSGSSALYRAIASNYFEYHSYFEPWNRWNPVEVQGDHIVKSLIFHKPLDYWINCIDEYDKVIYITRKDKEAGYRSFLQAYKTKKYFDSYIPDKNLEENLAIKELYNNMSKKLDLIAKDIIWYYEDLFFSKKEIDKLIKHHDLKIRHIDMFYNYFDTKRRYS